MIDGKPRAFRVTAWTDERLLDACLKGNQEAWSALIDKYKNLIYSIAFKYGVSRDDASDIFQQVCMGLLSDLPNVRDRSSLAGWLIKVTAHKCYHWNRRERRKELIPVDIDDAGIALPAENPDAMLAEIEREKILREALAELSPRCRQLIEMRFFATPPVPYEDVAKNLRIARGSIGFIRMRCLHQLRRLLLDKGFR